MRRILERARARVGRDSIAVPLARELLPSTGGGAVLVLSARSPPIGRARLALRAVEPDFDRILPLAQPALRKDRRHDWWYGLAIGAALGAGAYFSPPPARAPLAWLALFTTAVFGLRGSLDRLRRPLLLQAVIARKELSPYSKARGEPMHQIVVRITAAYHFTLAGRASPARVPCERMLIDVGPSFYARIQRMQPVLLLFSPANTFLGAFDDDYTFVPDAPAAGAGALTA